MEGSIKFDDKCINQFYSIIKGKKIKTVYQPIVSLKDGEIMGYEALSRVTDKDVTLSIGQIFTMAKCLGNLWELEKICRIKALESSQRLPKGKNLFLNVDANIMLDAGFEPGVTRKCLNKFDLKPEKIIFEITERSDVENKEILKQVIEHYKTQGFRIAIDDVGAGYSGLNRINSLTPQYLKLDYELVHGINESKSQKSLVELIVKHCKNMKYKVIAEGVETEEELRCLLRLGVDYGQGFLMGMPGENFAVGIENESVLTLIQKTHRKKADRDTIGAISDTGVVIQNDAPLFQAYSLFSTNKMLTSISVVNEKNKFVGILERELFEKNWWYNIEMSHKNITEYIVKKDILTVPYNTPKREALRQALLRKKKPYEPIIVIKKDRFQGVVEIKDLALDCMEINA